MTFVSCNVGVFGDTDKTGFGDMCSQCPSRVDCGESVKWGCADDDDKSTCPQVCWERGLTTRGWGWRGEIMEECLMVGQNAKVSTKC